MSGQYPPPNPAHPYNRPPLHQRPPPPWGHTPHQPAGRQWCPSRMVGSSINFYGSPHVGLPGREAQPWVPPQSHPKPTDTRPGQTNPLFGLQLLMASEGPQRIPADYQQEETMDLSSHSSAVQDNPKQIRQENNDVVRNGTILPAEVNGDMERTETDSIVTSVIATNPLREGVNDALNCSKVSENSVVKKVEEASSLPESLVKDVEHPLPEVQCTKTESCSLDASVNEPVNSVVSPVLKNTLSTIDTTKEDEPTPDNRPSDDDLEKKVSVSAVDESVELPLNQSQSSYLEHSSLSIDTDESKLVVAESSAEDIFGMSPADDSAVPTSLETEPSQTESSEKLTKELVSDECLEVPDECLEVPAICPAPTIMAPAEVPTTTVLVLPANDPEPHPSVENVETLLESMFNSQEESPCSLPNSSSSVPQSVIVSSGMRPSIDILRPSVDISTPMKEEELAMTLAEDNPIENEVKEEKTEDKITNDLMDEIEKKLEMLTESNSIESPKLDCQLKAESPLLEPDKEEFESSDKGNVEKKAEDTQLLLSGEKISDDKQVVPTVSEVPKPEASSSNNPFIEVESELEKMFAGIVEVKEDVGSDNPTQPVVPEQKKPVINRRSITKRKKANSRRPSDNSVFGGSSGDSTPVKKKGRKRLNESGNEKASKKTKSDANESFKKGKTLKDTCDNFGGKVKGPFVHIEGSKESPASVVVVNSGVRADDEDGADKASGRRKHSMLQRSEGGRRTGPVYSSSTLSTRYNSDTPDLTWVCVFCKRGPHCVGGLGGEPAGDLFGPYRIPAMPPPSVDDTLPHGTPSDREVAEEQKKRGGKHAKSLRVSGVADHFIQKMSKKSKRSMSSESTEPQTGLLPVDGGYEVWLHGHCAEWAPGLCIIGIQLVGLDDAVWAALNTRCTQCGDSGAGIGCMAHKCTARMHYHCASLAGWLLDTDTFISRCHVHRTRLRPS